MSVRNCITCKNLRKRENLLVCVAGEERMKPQDMLQECVKWKSYSKIEAS